MMNKRIFFMLWIFLFYSGIRTLYAQKTEKQPTCGMYMEYPAVDWREALPTGNGDIGAMLYGNVTRERVMLNHKRYFYHRNHKDLPDFSVHLPRLRQMMDEGRYEEASDFFMGKIRESGYGNTRSGEYQPGFDLEIRQQPVTPFSGYGRTLDFETGEAVVYWDEGGLFFSRSLFVSRADDVVVLRLKTNQKGSISGNFSLTPHDFNDAVNKSVLVSPDKLGLKFENPQTDPQGFICISGQREDDGAYFGAVAKIIPSGGSIKTVNTRTGDILSVENADHVLVLIRMFYKGTPSGRFDEARQALNSLPADYDELLKNHVRIHQKMFNRCKVDLHAGVNRQLSNERLLLDAYKGQTSNALIERMHNYGRFLLICSSNPDGLPANLQGVWNGLYFPPWQGSFFFNENIEMNYWQALQGNLPEVLLSLINLVESGVADFRENAEKYYGCRGVLTPIRMIDDFGKKTGAIPHDVFFTGGAGWLAQFFYDYWLFTGDDEFLRRRAVPFMKEVALFYEDFVQKDEKGQLKMYPSDSPENVPTGQKTQLCINATMDFAVMKEVFTNLIDACTHL
ncbi:MAG: glycoside hydrolase family 95 protein, partial [Bacteroidales bacterium]|nr:glycoside hydrolase family 95 protein [Bacteroidales bacterium]